MVKTNPGNSRFGFLTAMASNFFFVTRNVLATKFGDVGDMGEARKGRMGGGRNSKIFGGFNFL